ncbi:MAG: PEP-CTERM sorting domain-containing protein [Telmatospirillum sp.]|nr:PEP-CTERM sorting domain-containing protein [Telmatospirillum sp.]
MAFMKSIKLSGAIAAGVLALAMATPAHAGSVTFAYDYTTDAGKGAAASFSGFLNTVLDLTPGDQIAGYTTYQITSISGKRTGPQGVATVTALVNPSNQLTTAFNYDQLVYINNTTGLARLDDQGIAYLALSASGLVEFNTYFDDYGDIFDGKYVEANTTGNYISIHQRITQVPAPTALALLGMSLLGVGLVRRRKSV